MLKKIFLILIFLLSAHTFSLACSCAPPPTVNTAYEASDVVAVIKYVSVKEGEEKDGKREILGAYAEVQKVYKGNLKPGDRLYYRNKIVTTCDLTVGESSIGKEFLMFDRIPKAGVGGEWSRWVCDGYKDPEHAADELLYIENYQKVKGRSRIAGLVTYSESAVIEEKPGTFQTLANHKVKIIGNGKTYNLLTDKNGAYEIYDLPPGLYMIAPEPAPLFSLDRPRESLDYGAGEELYKQTIAKLTPAQRKKFEGHYDKMRSIVLLMPDRHAAVSFEYGPRNLLSGRVTGPDGNPLKRIRVGLIPAQGTPLEFWWLASDYTDENGYYNIDNVPPGKYFLAANEWGKVSADHPFEKKFYSGKFEENLAMLLDIKPGGELKGIDIRIPKLYETVTVSGIFLFADGKPAGSGRIEYTLDPERPGFNLRSYVSVNDDGTFEIKILKGTTGNLTASLPFDSKIYAECTGDKEFKPDPKAFSLKYFDMPPIALKAEKNVSGIVIKLPFKSCPKAK